MKPKQKNNREGACPVRSRLPRGNRSRFFFNAAASNGVSTLEMLIAFAVLILCTSAAVLVSFGSQSTSVDTQTDSEATLKAQAQVEDARALSRQDFILVNSITTTTDADPTYQKSVDVTLPDPLDPDTKKVTSNVVWSTAGRSLAVHFSTLLTNPLAGGACSQSLVGDWKNPQHYDFPTPDLISTITGNHSN